MPAPRKPKPGPKRPPGRKSGKKPGKTFGKQPDRKPSKTSGKKPVKQPDSKPEKLQKVLAAKGLGSRRAMEAWIAAGRVQVNGRVAALGARVAAGDRIQVDQRTLPSREPGREPRHQHLLYNKPEGEICSRKDPEGRPSVFDRLPKLKSQRWISVGRLDYGTSGLLLFTTDGRLASRLMHPSAGIEREYAVRVRGQVSDAALTRLREGVPLEEGLCRFTDIQPGAQPERGGGVNRWFYVVLMEGRNRAVRRLWESQGCTVSRLKRVRYGSFFIPSAVKAGRYQRLAPKDAAELYRMAGLTQ